jgi:hypothetical protein
LIKVVLRSLFGRGFRSALLEVKMARLKDVVQALDEFECEDLSDAEYLDLMCGVVEDVLLRMTNAVADGGGPVLDRVRDVVRAQAALRRELGQVDRTEGEQNDC